jgi:hypothetical protein
MLWTCARGTRYQNKNTCYGKRVEKKFWEELIAYFPWYYKGHIANDASNNSSVVACVFVTAVTFLPSSCLATIGGDTDIPTDSLWYDTDRIRNDAFNNCSVVLYIRCSGNVFFELFPSNDGRDTIKDTDWWEGFMKYAVEMGSGAMIYEYIPSRIWGFHSGGSEEWLACSLLCWTILRPWRWRRYVPPKRRVPLNALHGVIYQKKILFEYIPSLIKIGSGIQKLTGGGDSQTERKNSVVSILMKANLEQGVHQQTFAITLDCVREIRILMTKLYLVSKNWKEKLDATYRVPSNRVANSKAPETMRFLRKDSWRMLPHSSQKRKKPTFPLCQFNIYDWYII